MAFEPKPKFRSAERFERMETALDMPFSLTRNLGEQFQQGFLDSFGIGTAVRDIATPRGNVTRMPRTPTGNPLLDTVTGTFDMVQRAVEGTREDQPSLTEEQYKASPWFREAIPFEPGMTEDRAASLADQWDIKAVRSHFAEKRPFSSFAGQLAGQLFDPINYIPVFGQAAAAAAVARFGSIKGRALLGASDAAINTAAFGVLTSDIRRKFGDDVSFEAIATEVAMSALIGGAFGGGIGFFMRGRDARERMALAQARSALSDVRTAQESRAALNDAVAGLVQNGEVRLSPNAITPIERIQAEVTARTTGRRALEVETEAVTATKAGEVVIAPSGARVAVQPEVVDMATLKKATGALQVRNRDSASSAAQVEDIAINLDPARLMPNVDGSQGAPLVGPDNVIDSGNGRVLALERAADAYPERYAAYRKALEDAGYSTEGMERPVLISRRLTELSPEARAQFNADVNSPTTARMSAVELAALDRAALTDDVLNALTDAPVTARSNRDFVARFLANLPQNDRGALLDTAGNLNADGVRRIESTLVAAAYGDIDAGVVRRFAEATDDNTRAIVGAMADVAGKWTLMRRAAKSGKIDPDFDATPELTTALRLLGGWRDQAAREKRSVSNVIREGMAQLDLLSGEIPPEAQIFVRMFYQNDHFAVATGRETLAGRLSDVIDTAMTFDLDQPQIFGNEAPGSKMGMLANAIRKYTDEGNLFAAADTIDRPEARIGSRTQPPPGENRSFGRPATSEGGRPATADQVASAALLIDSQPARTLDELYEVAPAHQEALSTLGSELGARHGAEWRDPGVKRKETAAEKMLRKRYDSTKRLTDVVRGGFVVKAPADADGIAADLAARFTVFDEGWRMTEAGYFDRKLMVQFDDGTIGEVQFWHPDMLSRKDSEGHRLYEEMRTLPDGDARYLELLDRQKALYAETITTADDVWIPVIDQLISDMAGGRPASGNVSSNAASDSLVPESITSSNRTGSQPDPSATMASADAPSNMAGRPSQSKNFGSMPDGIGGTRGVVDTMARRFADAGRPEDEAAALGTMIGEFYRTSAARLGTSVDSLVRRYGLPDVQRGGQMDERMLAQVPIDVARTLNTPLRMPEDPVFAEAVGNTPGARVTDDGLVVDLTRWQPDEQSGAQSIRTGVFYLPSGSKQETHYRTGKTGYGGTTRVQGETLIRNPLFVKGGTGGNAVKAAYDSINGKGAYEAMRSDVLSVAIGRPDEAAVASMLEKYGADPDLAYEILRVTRKTGGNTLPYAMQENIAAHAIRGAGHDAMVGWSKGKSGAFVSEVFDVREDMMPTPEGDFSVREEFYQAARDLTASPEFQAWFGDSKVVDADGKPLVVYHATSAAENFDAFRTDSEMGAHFGTVLQADDRIIANMARDYVEDARVVPAFLSIRNPLRVTDAGRFDAEELLQQQDVVAAIGVKNADRVADMIDEHPKRADAELQRLLEAAGFDGLVYLNRAESVSNALQDLSNRGIDAFGMTDAELRAALPDAADSYVVFRPEQVKSAIGNRGTFDATDPRILYQGALPDPADSVKRFRGDDDLSSVQGRFVDLAAAPEGEALFDAVRAAPTLHDAHLAADDWALEQGRATGVEHLTAFDDDGAMMVAGRGEKSFVAFPSYFNEAVKAGRVRYATHNHPSNSGLSAPDMLASIVGVFAGRTSPRPIRPMTVTAMGHSGAEVSATAGPAWADYTGTPEGAGTVIAALDRIVHMKLQTMIFTKEIAVENAVKAHSHISNLFLHRLGIIDLRSNGHQIIKEAGLEDVADTFDLNFVKKDMRDAAERSGLILSERRDFDRAAGARSLAGQGQSTGAVTDRIPAGAIEAPARGRGRGRRVSADQLTLFQPAYHGTPHRFDRFSSDKIGTGEGAQAYGHGLYFASKKDVAQHYRDMLAIPRTPDDVKAILRKVDNLGFLGPKSALGAIKDNPDDWQIKWEVPDLTPDEIARLVEHANDGPPGRLFEVDVPESDELLAWDAPLSEQPPRVKEAIKKIAKDARVGWMTPEPQRTLREVAKDLADEKNWEGVTGETLYGMLKPLSDGNWQGKTGDMFVSELLRKAGIPGHRYLDGVSRSAGDGSYNFVIYDDSRVEVRGFEQEARGAIRFDDSGRSVISLFETADASTALHESGHHFLTMFKSMAEGPDAPPAMVDDWIRVQSWWKDNADAVADDSPMDGVTAADVHAVIDTGTTGDRVKDLAVNVGLQEQWARAFEAYAREGRAPTEELRGVFAQFKAWLTKLYRSAKDLNVNLTDDIRQVFDNLLTPEPTQRSLDVPRAVDMTEPKPDPVPDGLDVAEARLQQSDGMRDLAEQHGVAEDGSFVEQTDLEGIREAGRLLPEEEAELAAAETNFANAEAYGRSLKAAMACMLKG